MFGTTRRRCARRCSNRVCLVLHANIARRAFRLVDSALGQPGDLRSTIRLFYTLRNPRSFLPSKSNLLLLSSDCPLSWSLELIPSNRQIKMQQKQFRQNLLYTIIGRTDCPDRFRKRCLSSQLANRLLSGIKTVCHCSFVLFTSSSLLFEATVTRRRRSHSRRTAFILLGTSSAIRHSMARTGTRPFGTIATL